MNSRDFGLVRRRSPEFNPEHSNDLLVDAPGEHLIVLPSSQSKQTVALTSVTMATAVHEYVLTSAQVSLQMSIAHGPADVPLLDLKLAELLDFQCQNHGLQECLVIPWTGARWTYDFLRQESIMLAHALASQGIRPGDRVAIMAGNCEQYVAVFFACMRIGAILVILNNTYTASEARYALDFTGKWQTACSFETADSQRMPALLHDSDHRAP